MKSEASKILSYPVWVGSLAEVADKNVLMAHFRKFGPVLSVKVIKDESGKSKQFGYVNYHNHEVAEVAAKEMNGIDICGKKIKTKGPSELKPYFPPNSSNEKVDIRGLIDCNYYLQGECRRKDGQVNPCPYRHCEKARSSANICEKWLKRLCTNKDCPNLHPAPKADKPAARDVTLNRCDSHNAFKCYGQCGKNMCNTHFENERGLTDHVIGSQKGIPPCPECNAVFFNEEEKSNHIHQAKPAVHRKATFYIGDDDDDGRSPVKSPRSVSEPIGVFWDIENCQIPKGKSPLAIVSKIRERFYPGRREVEFMCVCDTTKEKKEVLEDLNKAQINIVHINALSKNAADDKLKQALRRFACAHKPPATIVVISGDINFAPELSDLRHRHELRVILLHNKQASDALLHCAHESVCFDTFIADMPWLNNSSQSETANEITITNLPLTGTSIPKIKGRLNTLSCNTGGKVVSILPNETKTENVAIVKFPDTDSARRAIQRLQKEVVFGCEIDVAFNSAKKKSSEHLKNQAKSSEVKTTKASEVKTTKTSEVKNLMDVKLNTNMFGHNHMNDGGAKETPNYNHSPTHTQPAKLKYTDYKILQQTVEKRKPKTKGPNMCDEKPPYQNNKFIEKPYQNNHVDNHTGIQHLPHVPNNSNLFCNPMISPTHNKLFNNHKNYTKQNIIPPNIYHTSTARAWEPMVTNLIQNTIHNSVNNGIDLLVTNLDESINVKEIRRMLTFMFREHSKVTSIDIVGHGKDNFHAFVKVPRLLDAQTCVAKLNNQMLFNKRIKVVLASARQDALLKMKSEVTNILLDTYCGWLPLNEFIAAYKCRHQKAFHIINLDHMKDLVYIDGQAGFQFLCLLHFPVGLIKVKHDVNFEEEIIDVLKHHNRRVPFASIPGLYWSYLNKLIPLDDNGEMIVRIAQNKKVCLLGNMPAQQAIFYRKNAEKGQILPLDDFKNDIIEFLKKSPSFGIQYSKFIPLYHQFFGRQCCISDYGFKYLSEILDALSDTVKIIDQNDMKMITFTHNFKQNLLHDNIYQMLNFREKHKIPVCSLLTAYYIFYGHKLYFRNYGFSTFQLLLASLDGRFKIQGSGESKVIMVCQQRSKEECRSLKEFGEEVVALIRAQPNKQLALHNLSSEYCRYYARQLKLAELGFSKLSDLVDALSDFVEIHGNRDEKIIYICEEQPSYSGLWCDVKKLLASLPERAILLLQLPDLYKDKMAKTFPLDPGKMNQFLKAIPSDVLKIGRGSNIILIDNMLGDYPSPLLVEQLKTILFNFEHFKASPEELLKRLLLKKICISVKRINLEATTHNTIFQITKDKSLQLTHTASRQLLQHKIALLLDEQSDKQVLFNHLGNILRKKLSMVFRVSDYGVTKLQALIDHMVTGLFQVTHVAQQHIIKLGPLGKLYIGSIGLLKDFDGGLLLCNFAPEYSKKYNVQLKSAEYGFAKIGDLVESFGSLLKVYGEKNMKVVVLKESVLNPIQPEFMKDVQVADEIVNVDTVHEDLKDLLQFTEANVGKHENNLEWWMEPVPDLPQPTLQPELHEIRRDSDLMSFTEFASENIIDTGINIPTMPHNIHNIPPIPLPPLANPFPIYIPSKPEEIKKDSDDFINDIFSDKFSKIIPEEQEPDLMRMLVGRVSPIDSFALPCPLFPEAKSSSTDGTLSGISDTYSCFSALENIERENANRGSYLASLSDIFTFKPNEDVRNEPMRPKLAANFQKP